MKAAVAFVISPLAVAALAPMAIEGRLMLYPSIMFVSSAIVVYAFTFLVALPVYFVLSRRYRRRLLPLSLAAFLVAALSFMLLNLPSSASFSQVGQVVLVQDGSLTLEGWKSLLQQSFLIGVAGIVAALVFWLVVRSPHERIDG